MSFHISVKTKTTKNTANTSHNDQQKKKAEVRNEQKEETANEG